MGLDLYLFKKSEWDKGDYDQLEEVWYGRKTWSVYTFLSTHSASTPIEEEVYEIPFEAIKDLYGKFAPYTGYITMISMTPESIATELDDAIAERVYDLIELSNDYPQLGHIWELHAYKRLLDAMNEIMKIYQEGDSLVMLASY